MGADDKPARSRREARITTEALGGRQFVKRKRLSVLAFILLPLALGGLAALSVLVPWGSSTDSASATASMSCSVRASCTGSEVAVFRMSSTANAHAGTPGGSSYGNVVCCGGVAGLGTVCSGNYDTVLTLSATDNAHVASDATYSTDACLSAGAGQAVNCTYGASCDTGSACLATISGSSNAHVADCDGVDDYPTKVCCYAGAAIPVGGIAELPEVAGAPLDAEGSSLTSAWVLPAIAAVAAAAIGLGGAAWYARRRCVRQE